MDNVETGELAASLVRLHGSDAAAQALQLADLALARGDGEGFQRWLLVAEAVNALQQESRRQ
jgi:hypothetical protein